MRQNTKSWLILGAGLLFIIVMAMISFVHEHDASGLYILGFLLLLIIIGYALSKWSRDFKKLMDSLPADSKLITQHIAAIDIGHYRFIYRVYDKENTNDHINKTYITMEVGIPFPSGNDVDRDSMVKEAIKRDLQDIIDRLQKEGLLTLYNPIVKDSNERDNKENKDEEPIIWTGQPFALEFLFKKATPSLLIELQKNIIDIIGKFNLQDYSWFVCNFTSIGKEYRYHKGNLLQSAVLLKHNLDKLYLNYKQFYNNWTQEIDTSLNEDEYKELYNAASHNRCKPSLFLKDMAKRTKDMFKGLNNYTVSIAKDDSNGFSVNLTIREMESASTYNIIASDGLWWFFSIGRFDNIYPITFDDESSACGFLLTILQGYAGQKNTDK